jgi:hypothetical protein
MSSAHEFWIEPEKWQYAPGETITANLRNGELFQGSALAWIDRNIARAEVSAGDLVVPMTGRLGDRPALQTDATDGLTILIHETTPSRITYATWEKFQRFVDHKDLPVTLSAHLAAGHPETQFTERYTRHAKSIVGVGTGAGADKAFGMATEFVIETNPYAKLGTSEVNVRLLHEGNARPQSQVEVFERSPSGQVTVSLIETDSEGRALIPVRAGHDYMLDAVVLIPSDAADTIYDTLWASLTFFVP